MTTVAKLTRLDFQTIQPYLSLKNMLLFLVVFAIIGFGTGQPIMMLGMVLMYGVMYSSYPFVVADKASLDLLYGTLPATRKQIVFARYLFSLALDAVCVALALCLSLLLAAISQKPYDTLVNLTTLAVFFVIFVLTQAIQIPIYFKLPYAKAKFLTYLPLLAWAAIVPLTIWLFNGLSAGSKGAVMAFFTGAIAWVLAHIALAILLCAAIFACLLAVSVVVSVRFYCAREF